MTPHPGTIRPATTADAAALRTLQSLLPSPQPDLLDLAVSDSRLGPACLVADGVRTDHDPTARGRGVVGYVLAIDDAPSAEPAPGSGPTVCHVVELVVAPDARRLGIGSALVDALADRTPADRLRLTVHADDADAQAFYESRGFSRTGRRTNHYVIDGESTDAIVMTRQTR